MGRNPFSELIMVSIDFFTGNYCWLVVAFCSLRSLNILIFSSYWSCGSRGWESLTVFTFFQERLRQEKAVIQTNSSAIQRQDKYSSPPRDRLPCICCFSDVMEKDISMSVTSLWEWKLLPRKLFLTKLYVKVVPYANYEKWPASQYFIIFRVSLRSEPILHVLFVMWLH